MKALLVTYNFPPVSSAGVWRTLKLAKYLPEHGVTPSVLTVSNPSVPTVDPSLARDVDPSMTILRARTFEPGYGMKQAVWESSAESAAQTSLWGRSRSAAMRLAKQALFPDPQVLWLPGAGLELSRRLFPGNKEDVVFITAPPFSQFVMGPLARARPGVGVVLDYRDEWVTYRSSYEMMGKLGESIGGGLERALLKSAHVITTATEAFRENLLEHFPFLSPDRVVAIPNGYDPDDFPNDLPDPPEERFVITYAGTVFKLTSPQGFLQAVRRVHEKRPDLARLLEVNFIGRVVETEKHHFEGLESCGVSLLGYMDKEAVMRAQSASHLVLCTLDEVPGNERIYPGKIFELMHLGRPVLTLTPPGALRDLAERHELGTVLPPRDVPAIVDFLVTALEALRDGRYSTSMQGVDIEPYHRRAQAGQFKAAFERARALARG